MMTIGSISKAALHSIQSKLVMGMPNGLWSTTSKDPSSSSNLVTVHVLRKKSMLSIEQISTLCHMQQIIQQKLSWLRETVGKRQKGLPLGEQLIALGVGHLGLQIPVQQPFKTARKSGMWATGFPFHGTTVHLMRTSICCCVQSSSVGRKAFEWVLH